MPATGDTIAGKYVVERVLGVGGMGVVVAARHAQLGQQVAIKFMRDGAMRDGQALERFMREARAVVALTSEHVARVLDVGMLESGAPFIVMEYLVGMDLAEVLRRDGPMSVPTAAALVLQACEAVAEAHALGIVHRDLKPANLFATRRMDESVLVKVLDFGISKAPVADTGSQSLTAEGSIMGSPGYMSPEQVKSAKDVDPRSDVWSLGVILYELLTGASPFLGETLGATLAKIVSEDAPPLRERRPDVPEPLAEVIHRCLERQRTLRVQSVSELAAALVAYAPEEALSAKRIARVAAARGGTIDAPANAPISASQVPSVRTDTGISATNRPSGTLATPHVGARGSGAAWIIGSVLSLGAAAVAVFVAHEAWRLTRGFRPDAKATAAAVAAPSASADTTVREDAEAAALEVPRTIRPGMLLFDADGDATPDVVGVFDGRPSAHASAFWLGAISGTDGHVLWHAALPADGSGDPDRGRRALVDTTLLVVRGAGANAPGPDGGNGWIALDARTGQTLWAQPAPGPIGDLCAGPGEIGYHTSDGSLVRLVALTGARVDPGAGDPCGHAYTSADDGPNFTIAEGDAAAKVASSAPPVSAAMKVRIALVPVTGVGRVVLGESRAQGQAAVGVVAPGKSWVATVAASGQPPVRWVDRPRAAVRHGHIFVPFEVASPRQVHVASFDLQSGDRTWDVTLQGEASSIDEIEVSSEGRVYARTAAGRVWTVGPGGDDRRLVIGATRP